MLNLTPNNLALFPEKLSPMLKIRLLETLAQDFSNPPWENSSQAFKHMHSARYVSTNISTDVINSSAPLKLNRG